MSNIVQIIGFSLLGLNASAIARSYCTDDLVIGRISLSVQLYLAAGVLCLLLLGTEICGDDSLHEA